MNRTRTLHFLLRMRIVLIPCRTRTVSSSGAIPLGRRRHRSHAYEDDEVLYPGARIK